MLAVERFFKSERAVGLALVLAMHAAVLWGLWQHRLIPSPQEAMTLFVNFIAPPAPEIVPPPPKPRPKPVEKPKPRQIIATTPVVAPTDYVAPTPPPQPETERQPNPVFETQIQAMEKARAVEAQVTESAEAQRRQLDAATQP